MNASEELAKLYYSATTGLSSADKIYDRVKSLGLKISKAEVKAFVNKQETAQVFAKRKIKHFYPLISYSPFSRVQIDLVDVSQLAHWNKGVKFLFVAIDVFTRYAWVIPIKNKGDAEVLKTFKTIVGEIVKLRGFAPVQLDSDQEASFMSRAFQAYCEDNLIHQKLLPVSDYKGTAVVDRLIRTIRELLNRYTVAHNTKEYLTVLDDLILNYNTRVNQGIGATPQNAVENPEYEAQYWKMVEKKIAKARGASAGDLEMGTKVRVLLRKAFFEKGTAQKWSSTTHTVESFKDGLYYVSGRVGGYKGYELQKVGEVERLPHDAEAVAQLEAEAQQVKAGRKMTRAMQKEGVEAEAPAPRVARQRRPRDFGPVILQ